MASRSIVWRQAAVDEVMRSPEGMVGQHLQRVGAAVTRECQAVAAERLQRRRGVYASSFKSTTERDGGQLRTRVYNDSTTVDGRPLAPMIEKGTRPHVIRPRKVGGVLVFEVNGETVFARVVNHPGTKAYRIMEIALRRVIGRD